MRRCGYLWIVGNTVAAAIVRLALDPLIGTSAQYAPFALSVVVVAAFCGVEAGLLATALGTLSGMSVFMLLGHFNDGWVVELLRGGLFTALGIALSLLTGRLARTRDRLTSQTRQLADTADTLRQSEQRFRALFDYALDAVFLALPDGKIQAANPAHARCLA